MSETEQRSPNEAQPLPRPTGPSAQRGFTLIEILVAMSIASVVIYLVTESYIQTMKLFEKGNEHLRQTQALVKLMEQLESDLHTALPAAGGSPTEPAAGTRPANWVLRVLRAVPRPDNLRSAEAEVLETLYLLEPPTAAPTARKTLVREVRRLRTAERVSREEFGLEIATLSIRPAASRGIEISLEHFISRRHDRTDKISLLAEPLVAAAAVEAR